MQLEGCEMVLRGLPICRGIAIGKPHFLSRLDFAIFETPITQAQMKREIERYRRALVRSEEDIKRLQMQLERESASEGIPILEAQLEMLQDPLLTTEIEKEIKKLKRNAEFVFQQALVKYQARFESIDDPFFAERFQDLQDLARRIFIYLNEAENGEFDDLSPHSIVCASELTASDAASAHSYSVNAFITEVGGPTSHAAIVAKAKGIPCVTNINLEELRNAGAEVIIVDGRTGSVIINPGEEVLKSYELLKTQMRNQFQVLEGVTNLPCETFDGYPVRLHANLASPADLELIHSVGGEGIGLFRSEYIFLPKHEIPSEEAQYQIYRKLALGMSPHPVVIRTFDLGGDKTVKAPPFGAVERASFLSGRATRFFLREKNVLKTQLRAILRACEWGNVSILFPMISTLDELREAKRILEETKKEVGISQPVRMGCMIEVPSAAVIVDHFVKECDFLSIGTNDLVQYTLALDRSELALHDFFEPTDPSLIRLIKVVTNEANRAKIPVSVCGEIASDPRFTALLLGLGIQELSVAPRFLPVIKNAIRRTSIVRAVQLADLVLGMTTSSEVLELIVQDYHRNVPEDLFYNFT